MKDKTKEALEEFKSSYYAEITHRQYELILDYIINLQESEAYYYGQYKDYKSRCEKASEMIRFIAFNSERPLTMIELNKVFSILQGSDKDE